MATVDRNGIPLVNGVLYGWAEVLVAIAGVPLTGITSVEYADKQEVTNKYGAGRYPVGRGLGRISSEAKITLSRRLWHCKRRAPTGDSRISVCSTSR